MTHTIFVGDVLEWCAAYEGPRYHALFCDPPYCLQSISKRFGAEEAAPAQYGTDGAFRRSAGGFMGCKWDDDIAFRPQTWAALAAHLYPGAYVFAFAGKGQHRQACAMEDAGLIIHNPMVWVNGSCLSADTEILTPDGWKPYTTLLIGSLVIGYSVDEDTLQSMPVEEVFVYDYNQTAYRLQSDRTDQLVTGNHRCLVQRQGRWCFEEARSLDRQEIVPICESRDLLSDLRQDAIGSCLLVAQVQEDTCMQPGMQPGHTQAGIPSNLDVLSDLRQTLLSQTQSGGKGENLSDVQYRLCCDHAEQAISESRVPLPYLRESDPRLRLSIKKGEVAANLRQSMSRRSTQPGAQETRRRLLADNATQTRPKAPQEALVAESGENLSYLRQSLSDLSGMAQETQKRADLQQEMSREDCHCQAASACTQRSGKSFPGSPGTLAQIRDGAEPLELERGRNAQAQPRQLRNHQICEVSDPLPANGTQRRLRDGTSALRRSGHGALSFARGSRSPQEPQPARQCPDQLATVRLQLGSQAVRASRHTCSDLVTVTPVHYQGLVWCVRVRSGAFVARRNGHVFLTGNSFPKATRIDTQIDDAAGVEQIRVPNPKAKQQTGQSGTAGFGTKAANDTLFLPSTDLAKAWAGHRYGGQAIKSAVEHLIVAQKPYAGRPVDCITKTGGGALNVEAGRVGKQSVRTSPRSDTLHLKSNSLGDSWSGIVDESERSGRWPSTALFDAQTILSLEPDQREFFHVTNWNAEVQEALEMADAAGQKCVLCNCLFNLENGYNDSEKELSCNKNDPTNPVKTVERSSTERTLQLDFALDSVPDSLPPACADRSKSNRSSARNVQSSLSTMPATITSIVANDAPMTLENEIVKVVKSAENLCGSCAIYIARTLVQIKHEKIQALPPGLDFISEHKRPILFQSLVQLVESQGNTDTIPTIQSLKKWCGSVRDVINTDTSREKSKRRCEYVPSPLIYPDCPAIYVPKSGTRERSEGLEGLPLMPGTDWPQAGVAVGSRRGSMTRNHHPCCKPLDLCQYLCRLLLPPDLYAPRRILIPFAGSGSECVGALLAGWEHIQGIEGQADYAEIAEHRLKYWAAQPRLFDTDKPAATTVASAGQVALEWEE